MLSNEKLRRCQEEVCKLHLKRDQQIASSLERLDDAHLVTEIEALKVLRRRHRRSLLRTKQSNYS